MTCIRQKCSLMGGRLSGRSIRERLVVTLLERNNSEDQVIDVGLMNKVSCQLVYYARK